MSYVSGVGSVGFAGYATNYSGTEYDPGGLLNSSPAATGPGSVRFVQQMLVELGALPAVNAKGKSNVDGLFGPGTSAAYQAVTGEPKVSGQSLAVLGTKYAAKLGGLTPTPPPGPPGPPQPTPPPPGVQTCPPGTFGIPPACLSIPGGGGGEVVPPPTPKEEPKDKTLMYVGIGAGVLAVGGILVFALSSGKKKKAVENKRRKAKSNSYLHDYRVTEVPAHGRTDDIAQRKGYMVMACDSQAAAYKAIRDFRLKGTDFDVQGPWENGVRRAERYRI